RARPHDRGCDCTRACQPAGERAGVQRALTFRVIAAHTCGAHTCRAHTCAHAHVSARTYPLDWEDKICDLARGAGPPVSPGGFMRTDNLVVTAMIFVGAAACSSSGVSDTITG